MEVKICWPLFYLGCIVTRQAPLTLTFSPPKEEGNSSEEPFRTDWLARAA